VVEEWEQQCELPLFCVFIFVDVQSSYTAPERFSNVDIKTFTDFSKLDVYSFGVMAWEVWSRCIPYNEPKFRGMVCT
jgi:hypothetical protein